MKIKKALNKAENEQETRERVFPVKPADPDRRHGIPGKTPWQPPVYAESKTVAIDVNAAVRNHCVALSPAYTEIDYYKVLRTQLRQMDRGADWKTVMITSVSPGEGKTVTAINLAATFAREYSQTVLLVDADLRRQSIHRYLGYASDRGLPDYLESNVPMRDIMVWPGIDKFAIISGGGVVADSAELMGSPRMRELVAELKDRYDDRHVIFDVPPVMGCADTLAFAPLVDRIILVVGAGQTRQQDLEKALEMLPQEKVAGFVLNQFNDAKRLYGPYGKGFDHKRSFEEWRRTGVRLKEQLFCRLFKGRRKEP